MSEANEQATLRQSSVSPAGPRRRGRPKGQSYMEPALLVTIRHRLKLSQAILAKIVGVSRTTVSMWENGHVPIPKAAVRVRSPDRKSTRLNSSHGYISYAVFCLKKKKI